MDENEESICVPCTQLAEHAVSMKAAFNNKKEGMIDVNGLNGLSANAIFTRFTLYSTNGF